MFYRGMCDSRTDLYDQCQINKMYETKVIWFSKWSLTLKINPQIHFSLEPLVSTKCVYVVVYVCF